MFSLNLTSWSIVPKLATTYDWFCIGRNPVLFFLGPFFYAFTKGIFESRAQKVLNYKTLIPGFLDILFAVGLWLYIYFFAFEDKMALLFNTLQLNIYQGLAILHNAIYLVLSLRAFFRSDRKGERITFQWIFLIISIIFISWLFYFFAELYVYPSTLSNVYYYPLWVLILGLNLFLGFNILLHPTKLNFQDASFDRDTEEETLFYNSLLSLMKDEKLFTKQDLTLSYVAGKLDITPARLSQIIRNKNQGSFYDFINGYRIEDLIKRFKNREDQQFTIQTLAEKAGFRSKTTFIKAFKKTTGMLPKDFLNRLN